MKPLDRPEVNLIIERKDEERKNKCTIIKGESVCLNTPAGRAQIAANDKAINLVDTAREICGEH